MVEIVSGYVALKKSGQNFSGLCPFHHEKSPSFTVSPEKQLFHCFGCGAGGNLFTFLMKMEGVTFPEAVRLLGKRIGLAPPADGEPDVRVKQRNRLQALLQAAAAKFHEQLLGDGRAAKARAYLAQRGITEATIEEFNLGYALPGWDALMAPLVRQGWTAQELLEAGLIIRKAEGSGYYDRFRDRVIFPIRDAQGRALGFGARVLESGQQPKYLNSPETALYSKGRVLYGLDRARAAASKAGYLIVVEGYFDVIAPHQAGIKQVVATLGTALTASHVLMLQRLVPKVVLLFDPDPAGVNATLRTIELFLEQGMDAAVATLPDGVDPDGFVRQFGAEAFDARIAAAQPLLAFAIERALACTPHDRIDGKMAVLRSLAPTLRKIGSRVELDHYMGLLAQRLGVSEASLRADLKQLLPAPGQGRPPRPAPAPAAPALSLSWTGAERVLLHLWFQRRLASEQLIGRVAPEDFSHPTGRALMRLIVESAEWAEADPVSAVSARVSTDETLAAAVAHLSLLELEYDSVPKAVEECLEGLKRRRLDREIRQLEQDRRAAEADGNQQRARELQTAILDSRRSSGNVAGGSVAGGGAAGQG